MLINVPLLVDTVVTVVECNVSHVSVRSTNNIQTFSSVVSDVSISSIVPSDSLVVRVSVNSDGSSNINSEFISILVGNNEVSSSPSSNGLGSVIECPPLLSVLWIVVSNSESVLMSTNMFMPEEGSVGWHS